MKNIERWFKPRRCVDRVDRDQARALLAPRPLSSSHRKQPTTRSCSDDSEIDLWRRRSRRQCSQHAAVDPPAYLHIIYLFIYLFIHSECIYTVRSVRTNSQRGLQLLWRTIPWYISDSVITGTIAIQWLYCSPVMGKSKSGFDTKS